MDEKRIRELIDACRPGSEDLADGAMQELNDVLSTDAGTRELYEQTQANDDAIRTVLHQVNVPDDLASRLMERLAPILDGAQDKVSLHLEDDTQVEVAIESAADGVNSYRGWSRRRWLAMAAVASAAAIGGVLLASRLLTTSMNASELSHMALEWIDALDQTWNEDLSAAPEHLPRSNHLSARPSGWQTWQTPPPHDENSTAYRLYSPFARGKVTVLFVTERPNRIKDLAKAPPEEPLANTFGRASGVWQEDDRLYVLVVPGGRLQYQSCLRSQQLAALLTVER
jgi:hypothetical protein